jgi:hypothetical protein
MVYNRANNVIIKNAIFLNIIHNTFNLRIAMKPVPSQEVERSCICALVVLILPISMIFLLDFETVPL